MLQPKPPQQLYHQIMEKLKKKNSRNDHKKGAVQVKNLSDLS